MDLEYMDAVISKLPRKRVRFYPTPFHALPNLSRTYGINLFLKREDLAGPGAISGSKTRLAEFIIGRALEDGVTHLITQGAHLTNSGLQFAAACLSMTMMTGSPLEISSKFRRWSARSALSSKAPGAGCAVPSQPDLCRASWTCPVRRPRRIWPRPRRVCPPPSRPRRIREPFSDLRTESCARIRKGFADWVRGSAAGFGVWDAWRGAVGLGVRCSAREPPGATCGTRNRRAHSDSAGSPVSRTR